VEIKVTIHLFILFCYSFSFFLPEFDISVKDLPIYHKSEAVISKGKKKNGNKGQNPNVGDFLYR